MPTDKDGNKTSEWVNVLDPATGERYCGTIDPDSGKIVLDEPVKRGNGSVKHPKGAAVDHPHRKA